MTSDDAYRAMYSFLEAYWSGTGVDDIGALLGDLHLDANGQPYDPAVIQDWRAAVQAALADPR